MIVYTVKCANGHEFEGWFGSSSSFEREVAAGEVPCPTCGSTKIEKAPMAPAVAGTRGPSVPDGCPMSGGSEAPPCAGHCGCFPG
ncbi:DUF1178 family protein [Rhizomicrobium electricum]|uniref:DUF1178 family protein n=1 Tax=Rhizomicrobium electricum TaxID=480070 RepID=A0ABP3PZ11_9PROT|nr:hypothetical protein [Rhizomicrobium electricum]